MVQVSLYTNIFACLLQQRTNHAMSSNDALDIKHTASQSGDKLRSIIAGSLSLSEITSRRPSQFRASFGASDLGGCNFRREQFLKGFQYVLRWTAFDDCSVREAMAQELAEASWSRQTNICGEPYGGFGKLIWESPVRNEAWVCCLPLHFM